MSRNLVPQTVKKFRGVNVWTSFPNSSPDVATDCLNVIPSGSGAVEKMRVPIPLTGIAAGAGLQRFKQFHNSAGQRQVLQQVGQNITKYELNWAGTLIDNNALNALDLFDFIESNNLFFASNGHRTFKWDGTALWNWGIAPPSAAPKVALAAVPSATPVNLNAAAATVTVQANASFRGAPHFAENVVGLVTTTNHGLNPGDIIQVTGCTPPDFNGTFVVSSTPFPNSLLYTQNGSDEAMSGNGTLQSATASGVYRYDNEVTITTASNHGRAIGDKVIIASVTDASFDGTFSITSIPALNQFTYDQVGVAAISGTGTETPAVASSIFTLGGRSYRISFGRLATGHVGNASDISAATGNLNGTLNITVSSLASTDPQCDTAILWSTVDGGSDYGYNQQITITPLSAPVFQDTLADEAINFALQAPLINGVPPVGKYLTQWQGRVIIANLVGDSQGVVYSGYERILVGRPEESFPINNRLHLALGADSIRGMGAIQNGLIFFSQSNQMFIQRGQLQDISVDAPVQFTAFLQPLPFNLGCFSHYSIVATPWGLVWLASDKTIRLYDGFRPPIVLSAALHPVLRLITPGTEYNARGALFMFLERTWYVLTCAINGSVTNNFLIIVDLDPDPNSNVGMFRSDIVAEDLGMVEDANGQRTLVLMARNVLSQCIANADTYYGYSQPDTTTAGLMNAYWRSGVFGNDAPQQVKMFRWAHVVRDPNMSAFYVQPRIIGEDDNFQFPQLLPKTQLGDDGRFSVNKKGRRCVLEVQFPTTDGSANLIELSLTHIPLAER